jgi:hypothetical protein
VGLTTILLEGVVDGILSVAWVGVWVDEGELNVATVESIGITTAKSTFDPGKTTLDGTVDSVASGTTELLASSDFEDRCTLSAIVDQLVYNDAQTVST